MESSAQWQTRESEKLDENFFQKYGIMCEHMIHFMELQATLIVLCNSTYKYSWLPNGNSTFVLEMIS